MIISTTQQIIDLIKASALKTKLRDIDELPGRLTDEILNRWMTTTPSVYVAFVGGREAGDSNDAAFNASWVVYVVTDPKNDARVLGPDDILNVMVPVLHGATITDVGTLRASRIDNLFSIKKDKKGARVHAVTLTIPNFTFEYTMDLNALSNFKTYHAEHSMAPGNDEPAAVDNVTLDQ